MIFVRSAKLRTGAAIAATDFLAALAYDDETLKLRRILEEMRGAFGSD